MVDLFDVDLLRMTFVIGIVVSVLMYEKTHLTTGSLVVPGYIGAQLLNPVALLATAINAGLTFLLVSRVLPRFVAVYGRARFTANIVTAVVLNLLLGSVLASVAGPSLPVLDTIGYVVPALIAYDMNRQGPGKTAGAVVLAGAIAAIPALLIVLISPSSVDPILPGKSGLLEVGGVWFPIVALISTGVSTTLQSNRGMRSGGFVGAMYLGLAATRPAQLLFFAGAALITYVIVKHGLKRVMISFGRRKFASMLMIGSTLSWVLLDLVEAIAPGWLGIVDLPLAALFVPALLANDIERTSPSDVFVGAYLAGASTLSLTVILTSVIDQLPMPWWALPLGLFSTLVILWPSIASRLPASVASREVVLSR